MNVDANQLRVVIEEFELTNLMAIDRRPDMSGFVIESRCRLEAKIASGLARQNDGGGGESVQMIRNQNVDEIHICFVYSTLVFAGQRNRWT